MTDHTVTLADADAELLGLIFEAVHALARLQLAAAQSATAPEGGDPRDVDLSRPVRFVLDEHADLIGLGLVQRDGTVQRLEGWHLSKVHAHLRTMQTPGTAMPAH